MEPTVSIIVAPRERFSLAVASLDSLLEHSTGDFELIYVDGNAPPPIRDALAALCARHGAERIRTERYLSPNTARNLGLARARGKYVVFVDNDVFASPGWLDALVACAEATGATVVSPLVCQGTPLHEEIHCAGGHCGVRESSGPAGEQRVLFEHIARQGQKVAQVREQLTRAPTGLAEFHCMLVRRDYLDAHGPLDARVLNTREHVDFCIGVAARGGTVWLEPASLVTYRYDAPLSRDDLTYYMLRWGDRWERATLDYLRDKYRLTVDASMERRMKRIGWRRREYVLRPLAQSLTPRIGGEPLRKVVHGALIRADRVYNRWLYRLHDRADATDRAG